MAKKTVSQNSRSVELLPCFWRAEILFTARRAEGAAVSERAHGALPGATQMLPVVAQVGARAWRGKRASFSGWLQTAKEGI